MRFATPAEYQISCWLAMSMTTNASNRVSHRVDRRRLLFAETAGTTNFTPSLHTQETKIPVTGQFLKKAKTKTRGSLTPTLRKKQITGVKTQINRHEKIF